MHDATGLKNVQTFGPQMHKIVFFLNGRPLWNYSKPLMYWMCTYPQEDGKYLYGSDKVKWRLKSSGARKRIFEAIVLIKLK